MSMNLKDLLLDEVGKQLGNRQYFTCRDLCDLELFSSITSAREAMRTGLLPYITMAPRRHIVHRSILLNFICSNLKGIRSKE
jgi:hypothetical protein